MRNEIKITLPLYKIVYPIVFIAFLAVLRGIADTREIGVTLDAMMAILSSVFLSETYLIEYRELRWEIFVLYDLKEKKRMLYRRIFIQISYLFIVASVGYFLFFIQNPIMDKWIIEARLYIEFLFAVIITISFFGIYSVIITNWFKNIWCGIGLTLVIWLILNSTVGNQMLGSCNIFAYVFRKFGNNGDYQWVLGKIIGVVCIIIMVMILPKTITTRNFNE